MKMNKFIKIVLWVGLCLVVAGGLLVGCGMVVGATPAQFVNDGDRNVMYSQGQGENQRQKDNCYLISGSDIQSIEVNWVAGDVVIEPWDGEEICLEETARGPITRRNRLVYDVNGDTLEIDYWEMKRRFFFFDGHVRQEKDLKILVPSELAKALDEISLDVVSSDTTVKNLCAANVSVDSVSGSLFVKNLDTDSLTMKTVSGNLEGSFSSCPRELDMDSVSGSVEIALPEDSEFQVEMNSVSGRYSSELPNVNGADAYFKLDTASGDFTVKKAPAAVDAQTKQTQAADPTEATQMEKTA